MTTRHQWIALIISAVILTVTIGCDNEVARTTPKPKQVSKSGFRMPSKKEFNNGE